MTMGDMPTEPGNGLCVGRNLQLLEERDGAESVRPSEVVGAGRERSSPMVRCGETGSEPLVRASVHP